MIFVGDVHGKTDDLIDLMLRGFCDDDDQTKSYFQVGDMGLGFKDVELPGGLISRRGFRFIRGNHDSPAACKNHPNYAGDFGYENGMFWCGGAWSIDQKWRTEGVSWWRDEELSIVELNGAQQLYLDSKPRIVVTHEAPTVAAYEMLSGLILPSAESNLTNVTKGPEYREYKKNLGINNTRTSQAFQQMFELHKPEQWIFGHYHVTKNFEIDGTRFQCLAELDTYETEIISH